MSGHGGTGTGPDQSMEDILASIRRILNDDAGSLPSGEPALLPPAPPGRVSPEREPIPLTEDMLVSPPSQPSGGGSTGNEKQGLPSPAEVEPRPGPPAVVKRIAPEAQPPRDAGKVAPLPEKAALPPEEEKAPPPSSGAGLLAPTVAAAAAASVSSLLRAVTQERSTAVSRGGPTIEDVVREELRPLLKEWLDQHLPPLVERLVRAEIERVVGQALG